MNKQNQRNKAMQLYNFSYKIIIIIIAIHACKSFICRPYKHLYLLVTESHINSHKQLQSAADFIEQKLFFIIYLID